MEINHRLELLEGELKIVKNEVKEILSDIRSAILDRENPFATAGFGPPTGARIQVVPADPPQEEPEPLPEPIASPAWPEPQQPEQPQPPPAQQLPAPMPPPEPAALPPPPARLHAVGAAPGEEDSQPLWSLLTISSLMLWTDDAVRRLGPARLELMLDLCEIAGYIGERTRSALLRAVRNDAPEPGKTPTANECLLALRELQALLHDEQPEFSAAARSVRRRR